MGGRSVLQGRGSFHPVGKRTVVASAGRTLLFAAAFAFLWCPTDLVAAAPPQATVEAAHLGVNVKPLQSSYEDFPAAELLDRVAILGGSVVRIDVHRAWIEPNEPGRWDSNQRDRLDEFLDEAARRHIQVVAAVLDTPCWASSKPDKDCASGSGREAAMPHPPSDPAYFARFAQALVTFAGSRVQYWEIWNEPNALRFWNEPDPARSAAVYAGLLKAAYPAIKTANPAAVVLGGSLTSVGSIDPFEFLRRMADAGALGALDALAYHPYTGGNTPGWVQVGSRQSFAWSVPALHQQMLDAGYDRPLWITESGVPASGSDAEAVQASYLAEALGLVRSWSCVQCYLWYELLDEGAGVSPEDHSGLFRRDLSPKPAAAAFLSNGTGGGAAAAPPPRGCPPARDLTLFSPTDFSVTGPAIVQPWWNNGRPSFGQAQVRMMIESGSVSFQQAMGKSWSYADTPACRTALPREFENSVQLLVKSVGDLRNEGLVR